MDKKTFIAEIAPKLKQLGYRKNRSYWYLNCNEYIQCINVEGSQWNKENYYVQYGITYYDENVKYPTLLHWLCRHRFEGANGELNIEPEEFMSCLSSMQKQLSDSESVTEFLVKQNATKVVNQFWF